MWELLALWAAAFVVVMFVTMKAHAETRREADTYQWNLAQILGPDGAVLDVLMRVGVTDEGWRAVIAVDRLDVSPLQRVPSEACPYCMARAPHTIAACAEASQRIDPTRHDHGAWWEAYGELTLRHLAAGAVAFAVDGSGRHG